MKGTVPADAESMASGVENASRAVGAASRDPAGRSAGSGGGGGGGGSMLGRVFSPRGELAGAIFAGVLLLVAAVLGWLGGPGTAATVSQGLLWASLAIGMVFGGRAAVDALREKKFDIDVLMVVGAGLAAGIGRPGEGALLLFLFTLAGALEELAMERTTRAVESLSKLMPTEALRWTGAEWVKVAPETLTAGDVVRVLPGELIPTDAVLLEGSTSVNQASLTGESMPRDVSAGDELYAGTINVGNPVRARVSRPAAQSSLQKIVDLVTTAQQQREPVQRVIDRVSQPYAIGVMLASIVVFAVWWLAIGFAWKDALYTAITLLIVASPCALIISTPTATLAAISRAARGGVLFKGGQSIERLARLRAIAFDKTGTLTIGRPRVNQVHPVAWSDPQHLLAVAAGLEAHSTHPIAEAIVQTARARGVTPTEAQDVTYTAGRGVSATVDGRPARLGNLKHTEELIPVCLRKRVSELLELVQHRGQIGVVCAHGEGAAVFILSDAVRPGAECLVERLHAQGVRPVVMLTGDHTATAARVATALGLDEFHAELLPEGKVEQIQRLKHGDGAAAGGDEGGGRAGGGTAARPTGVIGDGVNDAPALAAADVSIAIGSIGSDAALEAADIVLLADDLAVVPWAVGLARRARKTVITNLVFSLSAMGVMAVAVIVGSLSGYVLPLWLGVLGHEGGTMLVVGNSLLLLAYPAVPVCTCDRGHARRDAAHEHGGASVQVRVDETAHGPARGPARAATGATTPVRA